jgi:hypothetical protein
MFARSASSPKDELFSLPSLRPGRGPPSRSRWVLTPHLGFGMGARVRGLAKRARSSAVTGRTACRTET